jgi:hypothetical protein
MCDGDVLHKCFSNTIPCTSCGGEWGDGDRIGIWGKWEGGGDGTRVKKEKQFGGSVLISYKKQS